MARTKGSMSVSANFEVKAASPVDARYQVNTLADLTDNNSWITGGIAYVYQGMQVYVKSEQKVYILVSNNFTTLNNWKELGSGNLVEGYFNKTDNLFYEDSAYTTPISGEPNTIYISVDINKSYRYDDTNSIFVRLDNETGQIIQVDTMPTASVDEVDRIVQFIGTTTTDYKNGYFYKCVEDSTTTPSTYSWEVVEVQKSGDSTAKYDYTTNIEVGGIPSGTNISKTDMLADIVKQMLVTTYYPTFVAPTAGLTYTANANVEVKSTISAQNATVSYNPGAINLQGVKQNDRGGAATKFYFTTSGADSEQSINNTTGTFSVPALTRSTKGSIVITGKVDFAQGPQPKDSNGNNYSTPLAAGSVTATKTINFIQPFYYGKTAGTSISDFTGLTKSVTTKGTKTFNYTTNNEHMVFVYDTAYGNLSMIQDSNGFDVTGGWTKSTLTVDGFNYNVYIADSATTDTNAAFTFKF